MKKLPQVLTTTLIVLIFALLMLGGLVHNTGSSLACPDWPLCYGKVMPPMEGGILIEHSHRLLASLVGFLTILLCVACFKYKRECFALSAWALFLVILQGILGGVTVILKLPTIVSTFHLALSMFYFSFIIYIHNQLSFSEAKSNTWDKDVKNWPFLAFAITYIQIVWGAFIRHSGAGASCGLGPENLLLCLDQETFKPSLWPVMASSQMHMLHRYFAIVVLGVNFWAFLVVIKNKVCDFKTKFYFSLSFFATIIQIILGLAVVAMNISVVPTTFHLGVGALILACLAIGNFRLVSHEKQIYNELKPTLLLDIFSMTKPKLSALVLVTAFTGMLVAPGTIYFLEALLFMFVMALLVAGAAMLNCYMEIDVDAKMERTKNRPLPAKRVSPNIALIIGLGLAIISLSALYIYSNMATFAMAVVATVSYLLAYTPLKQKTDIALYVGAIPGALPPLMGWTFVTGKFDGLGIFLFAILFIWQLPHFLAIAIYHADDYQAAKIRVFPNLKGSKLTILAIIVLTLILLLISIAPTALDLAPRSFGITALVLSSCLFLHALKGAMYLKGEFHEGVISWARNYFWGTIIYLPLLLVAMLILLD